MYWLVPVGLGGLWLLFCWVWVVVSCCMFRGCFIMVFVLRVGLLLCIVVWQWFTLAFCLVLVSVFVYCVMVCFIVINSVGRVASLLVDLFAGLLPVVDRLCWLVVASCGVGLLSWLVGAAGLGFWGLSLL